MQSKATTKKMSTINNMFSREKKSDIKVHCNQKNVAEWELRPGGMVVQKRNSDVNKNSSIIKVKVKYGLSYHQIHISSHASFGELKKMLTESTGLHVQDQKLIFKKKVRDSKSFLDVERVKDGSKLVLIEDIEGRERRLLESLKIERIEKTSKSLFEIKLEVDKLAKKVAALEEASASTGGVIAELDIECLTENLMRILITLDEIYGEGELKLQRKEQVKRVQKHIETLDMLKMEKPNEDNKVHCVQKQNLQEKQGNSTMVDKITKKHQQPLKHSDSVVVTTKWETFE